MALTAKKVYAILKRQISDMEAKLNSPVRYRGTVATADLLPLNPDIGDMYNIESKSIYGEAGMNVAWNGVVWDTMGAPIDMSLYFTKEEAEAVIQRLVTEYFEKNPVKPGATTEQAQQIEQNKTDIASLKTETASLKEDISNKITKFYASSQGESHLADSGNGKIQDMMLYGRSEQKQYSGKNLLNPTLQTTTQNGVTCTNNGDGTYTVNGTATGIAVFAVYYNFADVYGSASSLKMVGCPSGGSAQKYFLRSYRKGGNPEILDEYGSGISIGSFKESESNIAIIVKSGATVNNLIFKPMLTTDTTATYADFEPYTGGQPSPSPDYPQEIKSVVNPTVKITNEDKTQFKTVTLPYTLNAIPVSASGNVTIDGQQYIADYVDVERGKLVRLNRFKKITSNDVASINTSKILYVTTHDVWDDPTNYVQRSLTAMSNIGEALLVTVDNSGWNGESRIRIKDVPFANIDEAKSYFGTNDVYCCYPLATPIEIDLTPEEIAAFKALATYYPTTNISVNSEQLDGYTVFNYPISMENGWNYVKQQIGDTRDYIYDMDLQSAEAYVNSEYAVALTELEV